MMLAPIENTWQWIREDWQSNPIRFAIETVCWANSLFCALVITATVPNLPYHMLYPLWISGTLLYAWCAWSRQSSGMLVTFLMIAAIDSVGYLRILAQ